jgi:hypothetical protein
MSEPRAWIGVYTDNDRVDLYIEPAAMATLDPFDRGPAWVLSFSPQGMVFEMTHANFGSRGSRFFFEGHLGLYRANFPTGDIKNAHLLAQQWPRGATKMPLQAVTVEQGVLIGSQPETADPPRDRSSPADGGDCAAIRVVKADRSTLVVKAKCLRQRILEDGTFRAADVEAFLRLLGVAS